MMKSGRGPSEADSVPASLIRLMAGCVVSCVLATILPSCLSGPRPAARLDCGRILWQGPVDELLAASEPLRDGFLYGLVEVTFEAGSGSGALYPGDTGVTAETAVPGGHAESGEGQERLLFGLDFLGGHGSWPSRAPGIDFYAVSGDPEILCRLEVSSGGGKAGDAGVFMITRGDTASRYRTATFEWTPRQLAVSVDGTELFTVDCATPRFPFGVDEYQFMNPAKLSVGRDGGGISFIRRYSLGYDAYRDRTKPAPCRNARIIDDGECRWLAWDPARDDFGIAFYRVGRGEDVSEELTQCRYKLQEKTIPEAGQPAPNDAADAEAAPSGTVYAITAYDRAGNSSVIFFTDTDANALDKAESIFYTGLK